MKPGERHQAWAANEADRWQSRGKCGHGKSCRCIHNIGREAYATETARLKAEQDERGLPYPPKRGHPK